MSFSFACGIVYGACLALSFTSFSQHPYATYVSVTEGSTLFTPAAILSVVEERSIEASSDCGSGFGGRAEKDRVKDWLGDLDDWFLTPEIDGEMERGLNAACKSVGFLTVYAVGVSKLRYQAFEKVHGKRPTGRWALLFGRKTRR